MQSGPSGPIQMYARRSPSSQNRRPDLKLVSARSGRWRSAPMIGSVTRVRRTWGGAAGGAARSIWDRVPQIGRASGRERGEILGVGVSLKKKNKYVKSKRS